MPRKPPTPRITSSTLADLSTINSSMLPIFSLLSLYTLRPINLEARHWPSLWTAVLALERSVVAFCARAAPLRSVAPSNAATNFNLQRAFGGWNVSSQWINEIGLSVMQQHNQDDQRYWYSKQPQKNRHEVFLSFTGLLAKPCSLAPSGVTQTAALCRRQRCRQSTDEQRKRQQDRKLHRGFAGLIEVRLDLSDHIADALVRLGLAEAGSGSDHFCDIAMIGRRRFCVIAEVGRQ